MFMYVLYLRFKANTLLLLTLLLGTLEQVATVNRLVNQFIYRDNTSHDDYNRIDTRKAVRKA